MNDYFTEDDRHYISLLQENMGRMSSNRANAKIWLATLATAIAALQFSMEGDIVIWVAIVMVVVFYLMDCLYLSLERKYQLMIDKYISLCKKGDEEARQAMLYNMDLSQVNDNTFIRSMISIRTLPFYLLLFLVGLAISLWPLLAGNLD